LYIHYSLPLSTSQTSNKHYVEAIKNHSIQHHNPLQSTQLKAAIMPVIPNAGSSLSPLPTLPNQLAKLTRSSPTEMKERLMVENKKAAEQKAAKAASSEPQTLAKAEHHTATPGPAIAQDLGPIESKEALKKRAEELNK
jgi:hypothetical protein